MVSATRNRPEICHPHEPPLKQARLGPGPGEPAPLKMGQVVTLEFVAPPTPLTVRITLDPPFAQRVDPSKTKMPTPLSLLEQGKLVEPINIPEWMCSEASRAFLVLMKQAIDCESLGDWEGSLRATKLALEIDPDNFLAWTIHSNALRMQNRLGPSLEAAHQAVALCPNDTDARRARALALQCLDRRPEALEDVNPVLRTLERRLEDVNHALATLRARKQAARRKLSRIRRSSSKAYKTSTN